MIYELEFRESALKEWSKLGATVKTQLKNKLTEVLTKVLTNPRIAGAKLSGASDLYQIKLRQSGYRLVYEVDNTRIIVSVIAIGKRERNKVYKKALGRLNKKI